MGPTRDATSLTFLSESAPTLDGCGADRLHRRDALADALSGRGGGAVPSKAERRDPGDLGRDRWPAVLLRKRAGKLEPGQPARVTDWPAAFPETLDGTHPFVRRWSSLRTLSPACASSAAHASSTCSKKTASSVSRVRGETR